MESTSKEKGRILHGQSKKIVNIVYKFMQIEADNESHSIPISKALERAVAATRVLVHTICNIQKEYQNLVASDTGNCKKPQTNILKE